MGKGDYVRLSAEDISARDKELKEAGMMPKNPKRRAAAYIKLCEMRKNGTAPNGKKPLAKTTKAAVSTPKKVKPVKAVAPKAPPKPRGRPPKAQPVDPNAGAWEKRRDYQDAKGELEAICLMRGHLGEFVTEAQNDRFSSLIDWHLTRYQTALQEVYPPKPLEPPQPEVSAEEAGDVEDEPEIEEDEGDEEPAPPAQMPLSSLPTPPPAPAVPPAIPKPPTL